MKFCDPDGGKTISTGTLHTNPIFALSNTLRNSKTKPPSIYSITMTMLIRMTTMRITNIYYSGNLVIMTYKHINQYKY